MIMKMLELRNDPRLKKFTDVRNISVYVFVLVVLSIAWSSVDVLQRNYKIQKEIDELDRKISVQELENKNAKLRSQYYNSDTFLELAARRQFGKALPGETVLIVPKEVSEKYVAKLSDKEADTMQPLLPAVSSRARNNFDAWMRFLFPPSAN